MKKRPFTIKKTPFNSGFNKPKPAPIKPAFNPVFKERDMSLEARDLGSHSMNSFFMPHDPTVS